MLEHDHRIGVFDRGEQHALHVLRRRRLDHLEAGDMSVPGLDALAVLRGAAKARPGRHAKDDRNIDGAAQHIAQLGGLIDDLLHRQHRKVGELKFVDRQHAGQRRADRHARPAELRDWRVHHPLLAEAFDQIAGHLKGAAVDADVLAHQKHPLVALKRDAERFADRFRV